MCISIHMYVLVFMHVYVYVLMFMQTCIACMYMFGKPDLVVFAFDSSYFCGGWRQGLYTYSSL